MKFGLLIGDVPTDLPPADHLDQLLHQVDAAQANGFSLVTIGQHFLYGGARWLQPIPTLARLCASLDPHIRIGTTVLIAPLYHPVMLAEDLATLDILSGGRLDVGLGLGYRSEEFRQLGVPYEHRVDRFEEMVPLLRELWTSDQVTHDGEEWQLEGAKTHIHPIQEPLPLWIGANTRKGVTRSARLGDAWPIGPRMSVGQADRALGWYYQERDRLGRPRAAQPIRREIMLGRDRADALDRFRRLTSERFAIYAGQERASLPGGVAAGTEGSTALLGSADQVCEELTRLAHALPTAPVIVRAQWPGMDRDDLERYLSELGRLVVGPMEPVPVRDPAVFVSAND